VFDRRGVILRTHLIADDYRRYGEELDSLIEGFSRFMSSTWRSPVVEVFLLMTLICGPRLVRNVERDDQMSPACITYFLACE
jgi:hypothetical protein